jgi:uncharacterized protein (TIGR02246 family)
MRGLATLCGAAVMAFMITGCGQTPANTHDADVKAINDNEAQWNRDYVAKDADLIASHYADDAVLMVPGMAAATGKEAIRTSMQQMMADPAMTLVFKASKVDVAKSGDLAYTQGSYTLTVTDPATHKVINDHGSYVTTYRKKADGKWKAEADIASSEVPPSSPASAHPRKHASGKKHAPAKKHSSTRRR